MAIAGFQWRDHRRWHCLCLFGRRHARHAAAGQWRRVECLFRRQRCLDDHPVRHEPDMPIWAAARSPRRSSPGGFEVVWGIGSVASGATIQSAGYEYVYDGAQASNTTIQSGGTQLVWDPRDDRLDLADPDLRVHACTQWWIVRGCDGPGRHSGRLERRHRQQYHGEWLRLVRRQSACQATGSRLRHHR